MKPNFRLPLIALALWLTMTAAHAQSTPTLLTPETPLQFDIAGQSVVNSIAFDVPQGVRQARVQLRAADPSREVNLYLRRATPFDLRPPGIDLLQLIDQSQYRSVSRRGDEFVVISDANTVPLSAGRWHLAAVNLSEQATSATLELAFWDQPQVAPMEIVFGDPSVQNCDPAPWYDTSVRSPIRGNSGTTLGDQRRRATQEAVRLLTEELRPRVPVRLRACWRDLGDASGDRFTLANAGPSFLFVSDIGFGGHSPAFERPYTWYAAAAAAQQAGTTLCRIDRGLSCDTTVDLQINFNIKVDEGGRGFDYGFTHAAGAPSSFVSVAMHEVSHGLGFIGLVNLNEDNGPIGAKLRIGGSDRPLWDDIFGAFTRWTPPSEPTREFLRITDDERRQALTSNSNLRFAGSNATGLNCNNSFEPPFNLPSLHAPTEIQPGSTYSHLNAFVCGPQLMTASISSTGPRTLGIARGVLEDVGFSRNAKPEKVFGSAPSYQYFDPSRNGHGIDFRLISPAITGRDAEYFMGFYTFDAEGDPEWFIASGPIVDGVFVPNRNEFGDSLLRVRYTGPDQSLPDPSPSYDGRVRVDFNNAALHPACNDGHPGRNLDGPLAIMSFTINGERLQWCMQPVVVPTRVQNDFSSIWYSLGDGGWGLAIQSFDGAPGDGLFSILYYADAQGEPRWALAQEANFQPGANYPLLQVRGYCRSCPAPEQLEFSAPIGSIQFGLVQGGAGSSGNTVSFDVTYPGPEGGRFNRQNVPLFPNSDPNPQGN